MQVTTHCVADETASGRVYDTHDGLSGWSSRTYIYITTTGVSEHAVKHSPCSRGLDWDGDIVEFYLVKSLMPTASSRTFGVHAPVARRHIQRRGPCQSRAPPAWRAREAPGPRSSRRTTSTQRDPAERRRERQEYLDELDMHRLLASFADVARAGYSPRAAPVSLCTL
jgi:hypothetical protein